MKRVNVRRLSRPENRLSMVRTLNVSTTNQNAMGSISIDVWTVEKGVGLGDAGIESCCVCQRVPGKQSENGECDKC